MRSQEDQVWYHVDVNSAYLSWTAAYRVCILGEDLDLRDLPSVIGGSEAERHGIVLAKSSSAKGYGIRTGETLAEARCKCPGLVIVPPDYSLYVSCSSALVELLKKYFPYVHQYSIDEAFCQVERVIGETFPGLPVSPYVMTGATDAHFYQEICDSCVRFAPVIYGPEQMKGMHGINENIEYSCLPGAVDFYKNLIRAQEQ